MTLARIRLRGLYGLAAGLIFLLVVPLYQGLALAPSGYQTATAEAARGRFGPFLLWASSHTSLDVTYRVLELVPILLALGLPGPVRRVLWPSEHPRGRAAMLVGQIGFICLAMAIAAGLLTVPTAASNYAMDPAHRTAIERSYLSLYAFETLLANVLGGGLIAAFLLLVSLRGTATGQLPGWFAYLGLATAGLLGVSAILVLFALTQPNIPTAQLGLLGLALWLAVMGGFLLRVQARPGPQAEPLTTAPEPSAPPS